VDGSADCSKQKKSGETMSKIYRNPKYSTLVLVITLLGWGLLNILGTPSLHAAETQTGSSVYLPQVAGQSSNTPVTPVPPPTVTPVPVTPTTPVPPAQRAFFVSTDWRTSSANIVADKDGGSHLVYTHYESAFNDPPTYGVYGFSINAVAATKSPMISS
jgi:hypothetical protein